MNIDEILKAVEQAVLGRQLTPIEQFILRQSWDGQTYNQMAQTCTYGIPHIKDVGSQLWHDLSKALGERVTKKNLILVLKQYQQHHNRRPVNQVLQEFQSDTLAKAILPSSALQAPIKFPNSPLPLGSLLYINRPPIEKVVYSEINQPGCLINIRAPRKMGKSSLLSRIIARGTALGYKSVTVDFQEADEAIFASFDKLLRWFCANVSRQLGLNPRLDEYWDENIGSKVSCKIYFQSYLLEQIDSPVVLALNEVNRVFEHPNIGQDFLSMLRFWHEQTRSVENWQKLRLVVVHTTEIYIQLKLNQSPFNVGLSIKLPPFTLEQVQDSAQRYGLYWLDNSQVQQLMEMVGGHPYLVNIAFYHLSRGDMTLDELLQTAAAPTGIYGSHLRSHLAILQDAPELAKAVQQVIKAGKSVQLEAITAYKLESLGLIQLQGNQARLSCELYRIYFGKQLGNYFEIQVLNNPENHPRKISEVSPRVLSKNSLS